MIDVLRKQDDDVLRKQDDDFHVRIRHGLSWLLDSREHDHARMGHTIYPASCWAFIMWLVPLAILKSSYPNTDAQCHVSRAYNAGWGSQWRQG